MQKLWHETQFQSKILCAMLKIFDRNMLRVSWEVSAISDFKFTFNTQILIKLQIFMTLVLAIWFYDNDKYEDLWGFDRE